MKSSQARFWVGLACIGLIGLGAGLSPGVAWCGLAKGQSSGAETGGIDERLVEANTQFAFELFSKIVGSEVRRNVFISPASVALALSMAANGARDGTYAAMADVLGVKDLTKAELNEASAALLAALVSADPKVELSIANSLWARRDVPFNPKFIDLNETYFGAEVRNLDFSDPGVPRVINGWVDGATRGKITEIVRSIPRDALLYLINAIYFKGSWTAAFDKKATAELPFILLDGTRKDHPRMHRSDTFDYLRGDGFQAVRLPYGNGRMSMYVFLPAKDSNLDSFLSGLSASLWTEWIDSFAEAEGDFSLPRFKIEWEGTLNRVLTALGMGIAFDPRHADFSEMLDGEAWIDEVRHKTYVEVNEEGTEAAAVTSVGMALVSATGPRRFTMFVDRPFFVAIRDDATGTILFMGAIVEPM